MFYALASADVFRLCDIMCGRFEAETRRRSRRSRRGPAPHERPDAGDSPARAPSSASNAVAGTLGLRPTSLSSVS